MCDIRKCEHNEELWFIHYHYPDRNFIIQSPVPRFICGKCGEKLFDNPQNVDIIKNVSHNHKNGCKHDTYVPIERGGVMFYSGNYLCLHCGEIFYKAANTLDVTNTGVGVGTTQVGSNDMAILAEVSSVKKTELQLKVNDDLVVTINELIKPIKDADLLMPLYKNVKLIPGDKVSIKINKDD